MFLSIGQMLRDPLERAECPLIIGASHRGARHEAHVWHILQLCSNLGCPFCARHIIDLIGFTVQAAPKADVFIGKNDIQTRARRPKRGDQSCGAAADHQKIAKGIGLLVAIVIWRAV